MNIWELLAGATIGLIFAEFTEICPWAARRLVSWAAYRWTTDPEEAAGYAEEWKAVIDDRPGKLFKLVTAVQFTAGAACRAASYRLTSAHRRMSRRERVEVTFFTIQASVACLLILLAVSTKEQDLIAASYIVSGVAVSTTAPYALELVRRRAARRAALER
ncbi:hypothetical protein AB0M79_09740 [Polymorphospora sp. NPDC051019]|uniref:hypothetical protein n=1 Tax=Polymorphospora sp. NPDC051019 TaxID=3155725 RepID=UPI0034124EB5